MLPVGMISRQVLARYMIEIVYIDINVIAVMRVAAVMIIIVVVIVIVMMVIVIIPIDAAKQRVSCGNAETLAKAFDETIGELLSGRRW